jgi:hypothetical protein
MSFRGGGGRGAVLADVAANAMGFMVKVGWSEAKREGGREGGREGRRRRSCG